MAVYARYSPCGPIDKLENASAANVSMHIGQLTDLANCLSALCVYSPFRCWPLPIDVQCVKTHPVYHGLIFFPSDISVHCFIIISMFCVLSHFISAAKFHFRRRFTCIRLFITWPLSIMGSVSNTHLLTDHGL